MRGHDLGCVCVSVFVQLYIAVVVVCVCVCVCLCMCVVKVGESAWPFCVSQECKISSFVRGFQCLWNVKETHKSPLKPSKNVCVLLRGSLHVRTLSSKKKAQKPYEHMRIVLARTTNVCVHTVVSTRNNMNDTVLLARNKWMTVILIRNKEQYEWHSGFNKEQFECTIWCTYLVCDFLFVSSVDRGDQTASSSLGFLSVSILHLT